MKLIVKYMVFLGLFISAVVQAQQDLHQSGSDSLLWESIPGLNQAVDIIRPSGSDLYVGGFFSQVNGDTNARGIAKWNGSSWEALGNGLKYRGEGGWVHSLTVDGNNVYVGGTFDNVDGNPDLDFFVKWDGSRWDSVGTRLNSVVYDCLVDNGDIYAGGWFINAGDNPDADRIAKWNGQEWLPLDKGVNDGVGSMVFFNGDLYISGNFTDASGDSLADKIARWNNQTEKWEAVGNGFNDNVQYIGVHDNELYAGGHFSNAGGDPDADMIAKWNGSSWESLGSGLKTGAGGAYSVFEFHSFNGDLFVAGRFYLIPGDLHSRNFARWDGQNWEIPGTGVDQTARTMTIYNNSVCIGGSFQHTGSWDQYIPFLASWIGPTTAIDRDGFRPIENFQLFQNYPNPFNPKTDIRYQISDIRFVELVVYDVLGRKVKTLVNEQQQAGNYSLNWDGRDDAGEAVASGVYLYRLSAGQFSESRKMLLVK